MTAVLRRIEGEMPKCSKCGKEGEEGSGVCPTYHGRTGDGFCPIFADGETALETATRFHDWWLSEARKNDELKRSRKRQPTWLQWLNRSHQ